MKGKKQGEVGGGDCKVQLRAETKVKNRSRRKKGGRGKENNKPCSTTTNIGRWGKCTAKLLRYSQCWVFSLKQPTEEKALGIYSLDLLWKVCSLKKRLSNCRPSAPAAFVCKVMSTPIAITNMKWSDLFVCQMPQAASTWQVWRKSILMASTELVKAAAERP